MRVLLLKAQAGRQTVCRVCCIARIVRFPSVKVYLTTKDRGQAS